MSREMLAAVKECILAGRRGRIGAICEEAMRQGIPAYDIIIHGINQGLKSVGEKYEEGEYFLPNLVLAGEIAKEGMMVLEARLALEKTESRGRIVAGSVTGDVHDIGKNIVVAMLRGGGFRVVDLGVNVPAEKFLEAAEEQESHIVAASATLSTTLPPLREIVDLIHDACPGRVKVLVGGAATSRKHAQDIGADGWAPDAPQALDAAERLMDE